jgi:soluble P-type ATPase
VRQLGAQQTAAIGNGRNDQQMLQEAIIGIAVLNAEGVAAQTLLHADVVCRQIHDALQLLLEPRRLIATLRA